MNIDRQNTKRRGTSIRGTGAKRRRIADGAWGLSCERKREKGKLGGRFYPVGWDTEVRKGLAPDVSSEKEEEKRGSREADSPDQSREKEGCTGGLF